MDIRIGIEVPLAENARPTYVEESLRGIDGVQAVRPDYENSVFNVIADVASQSEAKNLMKNVNRNVGTKYVPGWELL